MLRPRITPCLLIKNGGLVKTVRFDQPKYVGDPVNAVKIFNEKSADELIVLDIDATAQGREPNFRLIAQVAAECRMPLSYGGGVTTVAQAKRISGLGVEKIAVSTAVIARPALVSELAQELGSQSVAVVLDVREAKGAYEVWTRNGSARTGRSPMDLAVEAEAHGAGEIVVNSIDRDGMMGGYDLALATQVRAATTIPLTVLGGAGSLAHIAELVRACGIIGAAAGSLFVFKGPFKAVLINYPSPAQKDDVARAALSARG